MNKFLVLATIFFCYLTNAFAANFDRNKAVAYALEYAENPNSNSYPVFDSDCTNFASQILLAGGAVMSPKEESLASGKNLSGNSVNWFIKRTDKDIYKAPIHDLLPDPRNNITRSSSWVFADGLYSFLLRGNRLGYYENRPVGTLIQSIKYKSTSTSTELKDAISTKLTTLELGDMIFFDAQGQGRFSHATTVTEISNGAYFLSYHSTNRKRKSVNDFIDAMVSQRDSDEPYIISLVKINKYNRFDGIKNIASVVASSTQVTFLNRTLNRVFALLGISDAVASSSLFWYVNQPYVIKVTGTGFDGKEDVDVIGSTCDPSSMQRGSGYFTKECRAGNVASDTYKVRVYDTQYDLDIETPPEYQTMSLRGPILAPNAPTLADLGSGSVSVTWGAVAGVTSYEVYRGSTLVRTVAASTLTITDTGLTAGVQSCYTIRAIANGAASQSSSSACITPVAPVQKCSGQWTTGQYNIGQTEQQTQACSAGYTGNKVLTHTCTNGRDSAVWGATTTQDNCVVVAPVTCLGTWSSTRYNVGQVEEQFANNCPAGTQGQIRTFHTCQVGGSWSANAQSDTCVATLVAPTGLSASSVSAAQNGVAGIRLVWTAVSGATRYYITRNGSSNYSSQVGTNWTDPNATAGVQYCYTVNAFSSLNNARSPESSQVCSVYQPTQVSVSPPTNLAAARYTTGGRKDIRLTWTPPSPAPDSYQVFRRDRSGMLAPLGGSDTSFFDRYELNLTSGISYCYFIRSEKGGVISTESNEACSLAP